MKYDDKELDNLREFLARGGDPEEAEEGHLSVQELTVFQEGELSSDEAQRIEGHLSSCPACSDLLREIEELFQPAAAEAEGETGGAGAATDWRELRARLHRAGWFQPVALGARRQSQPSRRFGRPGPMSWRRWTPAMAAVLTLLVVGFYFVAQPDWFGGDRPVTSLDAAGALRGEKQFEPVPLSHDLILLKSSGTSFDEYRVEFKDMSTGRVVEVSGLREDLDHPREVRVRVPRRNLEPGRHVLHLLGIRGSQEFHVGTYLVDFQGP